MSSAATLARVGSMLGTAHPVYVLFQRLLARGAGGGGGGPPTGPAGGDLSGTYPNPTVARINGTTVPVTVGLDVGKVLTVTAAGVAMYSPPAGGPPTGAAGGDLSGAYPNPAVAKINGTTVPVTVGLDVGKVLTVTGAGAAVYSTPATSLPPSGPAGGDLSGAYPNPTVAKINGTTVPVTGGGDIGNVLTVTAAGVAVYSPPAASLPPSGPAGGDLGGTYPNPDVLRLNGATAPTAPGVDIGKVLTVTAANTLAYSAVFPVSDAVFAVVAVGDPTKVLNVNAAGQAPGTTATITLGGTVSRPFRLPDISGTALVSEDISQIVFINTTSAPVPSNSGIQYSIASAGGATANRSQLRCNLFGVNTGAPGVTGFKSRGVTVGALAGCIAGDILWRMTAIGVAPDNVSIPLGALMSFQVPASFVPAGQSWVPTEMEVQLKPEAGGTNGARVSLRTTSEGETQTLRGVRAGDATAVYATPAAAAAAIPNGALWSSGSGSPEGVVTGSPGDIYSDKAGGVGSALYVKETGVGTNAGWAFATGGGTTRLWHLNGYVSLSPAETTAPPSNGGLATFDGIWRAPAATKISELRATIRVGGDSGVQAEFLRWRAGVFFSLGVVTLAATDFATATVVPADDVLLAGDMVVARLYTSANNAQDLTLQLVTRP